MGLLLLFCLFGLFTGDGILLSCAKFLFHIKVHHSTIRTTTRTSLGLSGSTRTQQTQTAQIVSCSRQTLLDASAMIADRVFFPGAR